MRKISKQLWDSSEFESITIDEGIVLSVLNRLCKLSPRRKKVLLMRAEGKGLEEVGAEFGVTRERIRQMECKSIQRIRKNIFSERET